METLPEEMVRKIAQLLTSQDLAHCSAVSREWHGIFNVDCMWKPHCDPELEEPLRTIPCIATTAFVAPEADNSTLSPISHWKLAFMREKHLWKNWKRKEIINREEKIVESENNKVLDVDFLTDTLVVVWYPDKIEILDLSVTPPTFVAKIDTSLNTDYADRCVFSVNRPTMLLVKRRYSVDVYDVDIMNKFIGMKHKIDLHPHVKFSSYFSYHIKEDFCLSFDEDEATVFKIMSLNTGKILKKEPFPVKDSEFFHEIRSSSSSDFVAVTVSGRDYEHGIIHRSFYIYCLRELTFLPGPVYAMSSSQLQWLFSISLHGHWFAVMDENNVKVVNIHTREVLLNYEKNCTNYYIIRTHECFNGFLLFYETYEGIWVKHYSPSGRTLTTVYESSDLKRVDTINYRFILIQLYGFYPSSVLESVLKLADLTVERCDIPLKEGCKINRSCTKVLWSNDSCTWCVSHLW